MFILRYLRHLIVNLFFWVFTIIDLIFFLIGLSARNITIPTWVYWTVAGVGLIAANIHIYVQQENRIATLEAKEADLVIKAIESKISFAPSVIKNVENIVKKKGIDESGFPLDSYIWTKVEIENIGEGLGVPNWKLDLKKTDFLTLMRQQESKAKPGNMLITSSSLKLLRQIPIFS